jgi:hypothetical protein
MARKQTQAATQSRSAASEETQAITNARCFSRSTAVEVRHYHPDITMTSEVASRNEVASFTCSKCKDEWLSRPSTVVASGCGSCAAIAVAAASPPRWRQVEEELSRLLTTG